MSGPPTTVSAQVADRARSRAALQLPLPGEWATFDPRDPQAASAGIRQFARAVVGVEDDRARARRDFAATISDALLTVAGREPAQLLLCKQLEPDVPLPVVITVYAEADYYLSPSVGVDPATVADALERALSEGDVGGDEARTRIATADSMAIRVERRSVSAEQPEADGDDEAAAADEANLSVMSVDYWMVVPGSKRFVVATFMTPLVDIANVMARFFDAVVARSYFTVPERAQVH